MCFTARIFFFSAISNSDFAMLCLLQKLTGPIFCCLREFCVAMIRFGVCLCMLMNYIGLVTCALCVLLFASILFGEDIVASFWFLILHNFCRCQLLLVTRV